MPSKSEPLIHVCLYKGSCWVGTLGTARHKASLPPPPPIGGTARHGTAQNRAAHGDSDPPPPPYAYCTMAQIALCLRVVAFSMLVLLLPGGWKKVKKCNQPLYVQQHNNW